MYDSSRGRRWRSPNTTTWSRHSLRIEPISLSAYPFCQGERGDVGRSRMPIDRILRIPALGRRISSPDHVQCGRIDAGVNDDTAILANDNDHLPARWRDGRRRWGLRSDEHRPHKAALLGFRAGWLRAKRAP